MSGWLWPDQLACLWKVPRQRRSPPEKRKISRLDPSPGHHENRSDDVGYIPADADTNAVAATLFSLMHGLIVMHHLVDDVGADTLLRGLSALGAAIDNSLLHQVADPQPLATST